MANVLASKVDMDAPQNDHFIEHKKLSVIGLFSQFADWTVVNDRGIVV